MYAIAIYGVGEINKLVVKELLKRGGVDIVAAIDIDPNKVGKDLGNVVGLDKELGIKIVPDDEILLETQPDVVIHATGSYLDKVFDQIMNSIKAGANIISTCETLSYPWYRYPVLARIIDKTALRYGVSVLGTGINPGFLLDTLPSVLTVTTLEVRRIIARRVLNAAKRRESFKKKIGLGMPFNEVIEKLREGVLTGHVGYAESVLLIAEKIGFQPTKIVETQEPIKAENDVELMGIKVPKGHSIGIKGVGIGFANNNEIIRVEFIAKLTQEEYDEIIIEGKPQIKWRSSGTAGDEGTAAVVVNLIPKIFEAPLGLITMNDINYLSNTVIEFRKQQLSYFSNPQ